MRVLFVDHPEGDFGAAALFLGLHQELGADNVLDWPWKPSYHGICDDTYTLPDGKRGYTAPFSWMPALGGHHWDENAVASHIGEFDLVILASPRQYNNEALSRLISRVGRQAIRRLVIVDGEDYDHIRWDFADRFRPSVYFKREMIPNPENHHPVEQRRVQDSLRIVPFPFASPVPELPELPKDRDVVFFGGGNFPGGRAVVDHALRDLLGERYPEPQMLPHDQYLTAMSRAKIAIGTRGHGWDALRLWEIPSCPGTLMLRDRTPLIQPHPFVDGETCAFFDSPSHLVEMVRGYLSDEPSRQRVAAAGNRLLREHHTARARARQLLEEAFR